jgi:hypothetical protein
MNAYTLTFDERGVRGLHIPPSDNAVIVAARFAFCKAIAVQLQSLDNAIREVSTTANRTSGK